MRLMEKMVKAAGPLFGQIYKWKKMITFNDSQPTFLRFKTGKLDSLILSSQH